MSSLAWETLGGFHSVVVHPTPPLHCYKVIEIVEIFELASCMAENVKSLSGCQLEAVAGVLVSNKGPSSSRPRQLIFVYLKYRQISGAVNSSGRKICFLAQV